MRVVMHGRDATKTLHWAASKEDLKGMRNVPAADLCEVRAGVEAFPGMTKGADAPRRGLFLMALSARFDVICH